MPTYDYCCDACGHRFEQYQAITAVPLRKCPACERRSLRRLLGSGGGIIFKGSGFYQTDYRSESYKKAVETEKKATGSGDGKHSTTKPAAETDHAKKPAKSASSARKTD
jgi:putative FmdB family regulatory protein